MRRVNTSLLFSEEEEKGEEEEEEEKFFRLPSQGCRSTSGSLHLQLSAPLC